MKFVNFNICNYFDRSNNFHFFFLQKPNYLTKINNPTKEKRTDVNRKVFVLTIKVQNNK